MKYAPVLLACVLASVSSATEQTADCEGNEAADGSTTTDEAFKGLRRTSPESFVDQAGIWKSERWPIPVCWENTAKEYSAEKAWVEDSARTIIERVTAARFSKSPGARRWQRCLPDSLGIRIAVSDVRPHSDVGQQWNRIAGRSPIELPTRMTLNFELGGAYSAYCGPRKELCVRVIATHELLHAIGFLHEHLRCDAPKDCREKFKHEPDEHGYRPVRLSEGYDADSIMNYCESIYRTPVRLSDDDVEAVQHFYKLQ
jgi:hypothetical protein